MKTDTGVAAIAAAVVFCASVLQLRSEEAPLKYTESARDLVTEGERTFRCMKPIQYPDNDREFLVDHLFRDRHTSVRHWHLLPGTGCESPEWQHGYTPVAFWQAASAGSVLTLRGNVEADLAGFAELCVRVLASKDVQVTISADIDGSMTVVSGPAPGVDDYGEYRGAIQGKRLHAVDVRIETTRPGPHSNAVMWVMLVKPGEPTPFPKPDPAWPGMLAENPPADPKPLAELLFGTSELVDLRDTLASSTYRKRWAAHIRATEKALQRAPEDGAGSVVATNTRRYGRAHIHVKPYSCHRAVDLAYVGLVEKRPDMLRHAARWALTRTLCKRWVEYGIEALDGLELSHGRFAQSYQAYAMALVLDWAGSALTDEGRRAVAEAIHEKGVIDIDGIMSPGSYVWTSNQGLVFEKGRFAGAAAIRRWYPEEFPRRQADARKMLAECTRACIKPDGTGMEGPAYWHYTVAQVPPLACMLAKTLGCNVPEVVPPEVASSAHWAWINRRTDTDRFLMLTYSDSGYDRGISADLSVFFAGHLGLPEYFKQARRQAASRVDPLFLQCVQAMPAEPDPLPEPRTLTVFRDSGHVDIRQADPRAGMRLYFLSGEWGGKSHGDRNSFILEAFGKTLLLDRATSYYTHPLHHAMIGADAHNTVVADDLNQTKKNHALGAELLRVEEDGPFVFLESDAARAWPGLGKRVARRLIHLRPATLIVEDIVDWERPVVTHQYWQSHGEWRREGNEWIATVDGVQLGVSVLWPEGCPAAAAQYAIDGKHRPVYRLDVSLPRAAGGRILTVLRARPDAGRPWPCSVTLEPDAHQLRLTPGTDTIHTVGWSEAGPVVGDRLVPEK